MKWPTLKNPNYADALLYRGIAFIPTKDYKLALVHFNMLETQDPKVMKFLRDRPPPRIAPK